MSLDSLNFGLDTMSPVITGLTLTSPTINGTIATTGLTLPAVTLGGAITAYAGSGIVRTATKVVAASDSDATAKLQADYVCDGTSDEVELLASLVAAGTRGSVLWHPGNYTLGAELTFPDSLDGFVLYAEGTKLTFSPGTGDAVVVRGINESRLYFGEIVSNTTGTLLTIKPTATHYKYNKITFVHLGGIAVAQSGIGLKIDNSVQGLNVGQVFGGDIVYRGTGVQVVSAPDAGHKQDTLWFWLNHIRECTTLIQEGTGATPNIDTNVWHANLGNPITMGLNTYAINGKYFLQIENGSGKVITLNAGVTNAIIETSPPLISGDLIDNSSSATNKITTSLGDLGNLAFYSGTAFQVSFDHAASANRVITVPDATDTMALIAATQTLTNKTLDAGAGSTAITTTGAGGGLGITSTQDGGQGARIQLRQVSTSVADNDEVGFLQGSGKDDGAANKDYGKLSFLVEDKTTAHADGKFSITLLASNSDNLALTLSSAGVLAVDLGGSGSAAQVDLFDDYDDALMLRQGIQQNNQELLANIGVLERKDTGSGYMMNIQPMVRLLAGGIYQSRAMIDELRERLELAEGKLKLLGVG